MNTLARCHTTRSEERSAVHGSAVPPVDHYADRTWPDAAGHLPARNLTVVPRPVRDRVVAPQHGTRSWPLMVPDRWWPRQPGPPNVS
ncbi:hypothetical protein ACFPM0_29945 [Pseudonocardia sulfidoxydans]|uniref:hypothetical protein n=1 Tax=Pseudonocardia sulfidoxydans TaxID=54011 RepID=UPI00361515A8